MLADKTVSNLDAKWLLGTLEWLSDPEAAGGITTCEAHNGHGFKSDCAICSKLRTIRGLL